MRKICDARVAKMKIPSPITWDDGTAKVASAVNTYADTDASVHLHAIRVMRSKRTQLRQSNMVTLLANWSFLAVRGFYALLEQGNYGQHVSIGC